VSVSRDPGISNRCASVLSETELQRAERFAAEDDRAEFEQRRAFRRFCGATALGSLQPLSEILFEETENGRPYLSDFLKDGGIGGRNLDARAQFCYFATVNTPAIVWKLIGKGSQYAWGYLDASGDYLDGGKTYTLNLPKDAPAEKFISIVVYDSQTRSQLQTSQPFPRYNNVRDKDKVIVNDDGSVDLYFGPKAPAGKEANWLQTVPDKGWFILLRLYSPTEAWFGKTWRPGEIELVK
jgi:hypothetical protein